MWRTNSPQCSTKPGSPSLRASLRSLSNTSSFIPQPVDPESMTVKHYGFHSNETITKLYLGKLSTLSSQLQEEPTWTSASTMSSVWVQLIVKSSLQLLPMMEEVFGANFLLEEQKLTSWTLEMWQLVQPSQLFFRWSAHKLHHQWVQQSQSRLTMEMTPWLMRRWMFPLQQLLFRMKIW